MEIAQQMRVMSVGPQGSAVAMGFFDGVHIGHQSVIRTAVELAREHGLKAAVFTFRLPPESRIKGPRLLPTEEKHRRVAAMGVEHYMAPAFEEFRSLTPEQFVDELLVGCFNAKALCCGDNFTFGKNKAGNVEVLRSLCARRGILLQVVPMQQHEGRPASSTRIRQALLNGDVPGANAMLGAPYQIDFEVQRGKSLGRTLGVPTINQIYPEGFQTPREGVYITRTFAGGRWWPSATGFGRRPTVAEQGAAATCETFIPGFEGDLYGQCPVVEFHAFLEPSRKFNGLDELAACVLDAAEKSRRYFAARGE
ncbi:MAG: riboflavin biosynthesis protein RibF [Oscillospiraceae bacterium]|nr:riboflavin biosynthesis protein RibF [Oscillospiraceae bacterium]